jgi:YVTN family beta-propeller protein
MLLVLDTATDQVVGSVDVGPRPWGLALAPDATTVYTANGPSNDVSVVDVRSMRVTKKVPVGQGPWGIALVKRDVPTDSTPNRQ